MFRLESTVCWGRAWIFPTVSLKGNSHVSLSGPFLDVNLLESVDCLIGQSLTPLGRISLRDRIATLKSNVCLWSYSLFWLFHLVSADKWLAYWIQGSGEAVLGWRSPSCYGAATACPAVSTAQGDFPFGFCSLCSHSSGWRSHKEKQGKW